MNLTDKTIINPQKVRGLGNIVSPKTLSDFNNYYSKVTSGTDTVDGDTRTVYTSEYLTGSMLTLTCPRVISPDDESFTVTALLQSNNNVISGAELSCIVDGITVLTGTTGNDGECTFTVPVFDEENYIIKVVYNGTNNLSGCFAGSSVYVGAPTNITLFSQNKEMEKGETNLLVATVTGDIGENEDVRMAGQTVNIYEEYEPILVEVGLSLPPEDGLLSAYHGDSAVLTATVVEKRGRNMSGMSIVFKKDDTILATKTLDSSNQATFEYEAAGDGWVTITAECGNVESNPKYIEDYLYYNECADTNDLIIDTNVSCTSNNGMLEITTTLRHECYVTLPISFGGADDFVIEWEVPQIGTTQNTAFWLNAPSTANGLWCCYTNDQSKLGGGVTGSIFDYPTSFNAGDIMKLQQLNGVITIFHNDSIVYQKTTTMPNSTYQFGYYTNSGRHQFVDNIKIKKIN